MRKLKRFFILVIIISGSIWLLKKADVLSPLRNLWKAEPVVIDETPIVLKEIRSIGQLITYSMYDEVVVSSTLPTRGSGFVNSINKILPVKLPSADKQIVLIGRGKVLAGTDLHLLDDSAVTVRKDTVTVYIPKPKIIETILNPSDFETFKETGEWTTPEVTTVKLQAREKIMARALQQNILDKAGIKSKEILYKLLITMGYKEVFIIER